MYVYIYIGLTLSSNATWTPGNRCLRLSFGRPHRLGLPMVVCVECLPADKQWDVVSATRRSSGVAPRTCVRVYARVCWCRRIFTYIHTYIVY